MTEEMKVICTYSDECTDETCLHHGPHESGLGCRAQDCEYMSADDAKCVVDTSTWPKYREAETTAIMFPRRRA